MSLEQISYIAQIAASVGVIISLAFVGLQVRQNTALLYRNEHNSTMAQWTVVRSAIVLNRDVAELMTAGLHGERDLDAADQLRLEQFLAEHVWASFHIWDREQRGVFEKGTFEYSTGSLLAAVLATKRGLIWWNSAKTKSFPPPFVADVDAALRKEAGG